MKRELYEVVPVEEMELKPASIYTALMGGRIPMVVQYLGKEFKNEGLPEWKSVPMAGGVIEKGVTHILQPLLKSEGRSFTYKDKSYLLLCESKIKSSGMAKALDGSGLIYAEEIPSDLEWIEVVIYMCLYENPDGMIWVREKNQFYELFKPNK